MNSLIVLTDSTFWPVVSTVSVNPATGILTNQRRAQQRGRTAYVSPPVFVTVLPPVLWPIKVSFAGSGFLRRRLRTTTYVAPPVVIYAAAPFAPISVNTATGILTNQRRLQQRRPRSFLTPPILATSALAPPLVVAIDGAVLLRRPRRRRIVAYVSPPVLVVPAVFYAAPVAINTATGLLTNQRRVQQRKPRSFLSPPIPPTAAAPSPPISVNTATGMLTNQRRAQQRRPRSFLSKPLLPPFVAAPTIATPPFDHGRRRRRPLSTNLFPPIIPTATTFVAAPIDVTTVAAAARLCYRLVRGRRALGVGPINPPAAGNITTVRTVLALGNRLARVRRGPRSVLAPPIIPTTTFVAPPVRVTIVRTRRPRAAAVLGVGPINGLPALDVTTVATWLLFRSRRRPTRSFLSVPILSASTFVAPPTVATPPFDHGRRRRRPLSTTLFPPTVLQTFGGPLVKLQSIQTRVTRQRPTRRFLTAVVYPQTSVVEVVTVRTRPRKTHSFLTSVSYPATGEITVVITRTRPRPTRHSLTAVSYPATSSIVVDLAGGTRQADRRRGTRSTVAPPTTLQTFAGPTVKLARTRPRRTRSTLTAVSYPQTSKIAATIVRARPRKTRWFLTNVAYPQVTPLVENEIAVKTVLDDRRRRAARSTLSPPVFYAQTSEIAVAIVRTRRALLHSSLPVVIVAATTTATFPGPSVEIVRTRPRRVHSFLTSVVYPATSAIQTRIVTTRPRKTHSFLTNVVYAATSVIRASSVRTRPRHTRSFLTAVSYPATSQLQTHLVRTRPRPTRHSLTAVTYPQTTPVTESEVFVKTAIDDRRRRGTRSFLSNVSYPATSSIVIRLVRVRPRPTRHFVTAVAYPQVTPVFETEVFVKTVLDDRRRRGARSFLTAVSYPATSNISTRLVTARPRRTHSFLTAVSYPQTSVVHVTNVRTRPRRTHWLLTAVSYPQATPVVETEVFTKTVVDDRRRRNTRSFLTAVSYPATSAVSTRLVTTRPRKTRWFLTNVTYAATSTIVVKTVRTRPRPTRHFVAPPTVHQVFPGPVEVEVVVKTVLDDRRRRAPKSVAIQPVTYPQAQTSEVAVSTVRVRPRKTRSFLTSVSYPATSVISTRLVHTRPRRTRSLLTAVGYTATSVIVAKTVRTRPRPTTSFLSPPTALRTFPGPAVSETRIRPRHIRSTVSPPTVVRVPSVEQAEDTIRVTLVHTRPRPTTRKLAPPTVVVTHPPVVTTIEVVLVAVPTRAGYRRHVVEHFLSPPTAVIPVPTLRMQTVATVLVRTRPRPVHARLTAVAYRATSVIQTHLVETRPRPVASVLAPPTTTQTFGPPVEVEVFVKTVVDDRRRRSTHSFLTAVTYPQASTVRVVTARTRPRKTRSFLTSVSYPAVSKIQVHLARVRPRPTSKHLGAPVALQTFSGPFVAPPTRTRPRRTIYHAAPVVYAATSEITVSTVRTRPRLTTYRLSPPATLRVFPGPVEVEVAVQTVVVDRYRRGVRSRLAPPVAFPASSVIRTALAHTRPRRVHSLLAPPTVVAPAATFAGPRVTLARTRPRPTRSRLAPPTVVTAAVVVEQTVRVVLAPARSRVETLARLNVVPIAPRLPAWTTGETVPAAAASAEDIGAAGGETAATPSAGASAENAPGAGGTINSVGSAVGEITDKRGGLPE